MLVHNRLLAPMVLGKEIETASEIWDLMKRVRGNRMAKAAIEMRRHSSTQNRAQFSRDPKWIVLITHQPHLVPCFLQRFLNLYQVSFYNLKISESPCIYFISNTKWIEIYCNGFCRFMFKLLFSQDIHMLSAFSEVKEKKKQNVILHRKV